MQSPSAARSNPAPSIGKTTSRPSIEQAVSEPSASTARQLKKSRFRRQLSPMHPVHFAQVLGAGVHEADVAGGFIIELPTAFVFNETGVPTREYRTATWQVPDYSPPNAAFKLKSSGKKGKKSA